MHVDTQLNVLLEILFSVFLGAVIGLEREFAGKAAGLRTHMLIAGVTTFLVAMGHYFLHDFREAGLGNMISSDAFRIMGAIITGLSFVGAGAIIQNKREDRVEGLTTASSILFVGAIGIAVALEQFILATGCTILVLIINKGVFYFEKYLAKKTEKVQK